MELNTYQEITQPNLLISGTNPVLPENKNNIEVHPLFNDLILENILKFCQFDQDKKSFSALRLVCKDWDYEICRILRKTTEIPITRLLSPYPDGLGWTWDPQNENSRYFNCPYPNTKPFENIKIIGTCEQVNDLQLIRFLAIEGHKIKILHFVSTLYCGHQTKFIWDILHSWCPNLETLHLTGIQTFSCLLNSFKWEQDFNQVSHWEFNCDKLRSLILSIEDIQPASGNIECDGQLDKELTSQLSNYINSLKAIHRDIKRTSNSINSIEQFATLSKFIEIDNEIPQNFQQDSSARQLKRYLPKHYLDFGILGHILREAPIQKLVIEKLEKPVDCEKLLLYLLHHPSNRWKNLKHLEFHVNVHLCYNRLFAPMLSFLQSPLTTFHLDNLLPFENSLASIYKFLKNCAGNLEHLEIGNYSKPGMLIDRTKNLRIPLLPKLKTLIIKSSRCFWVNHKTLLRNAPNLKILSILENSEEPEDLKNKHVDFFCRILKKKHLAYTNTYQVKELKLAGYLCIRNIKKVCNKQFCNVVKVELSVDGSSVLEHLLKGMSSEWKMLEDVKLLIGSKRNAEKIREIVRCNYVFRDNISKLQSLKCLNITFQHWANKFYLSVKSFEDGFCKMESLTSLKLTNFRMLEQDKDKIERYMLQIPYVSVSEMEYVLSSPKMAFPKCEAGNVS